MRVLTDFVYEVRARVEWRGGGGSWADAESLKDNAAQFFVNRRLAIGLIVLLVADFFDRQQSRAREFFHFPLDSADADSREANNLVEVIAPVGIAEKQPQYLTLRPGKERITYASCIFYLYTHIGNDNTFIGNY